MEAEPEETAHVPDAPSPVAKDDRDSKSRPKRAHSRRFVKEAKLKAEHVVREAKREAGQLADEARFKNEQTVRETGSKAEQAIREAENKAEQVVLDAELKAEQIIEEAEKKADAIREEACELGRSEGFEEAVKKGEEDLQTASETLKSLVARMETREAELIQLLTPMLANLSIEVARKIIHREVADDSSIVTSQAEKAISKILEREKLLIRVHPSDEAVMKNHKAELKDMFDGIDKLEVIGDSSVERGGCIVETSLVRVDAQPKSQLEAARMTLLGETGE
jgi:flagellar assembly protein FliH